MASNKKSKSSSETPANIVNEPAAPYYVSPKGFVGDVYTEDEDAFTVVANNILGTQGSAASNSNKSRQEYIYQIREGIKKQALDDLMGVTDITSQEMSQIMHTSERTFRRYNADTRLNPEQSERVIELARLFTRGYEVFGKLHLFTQWMNTDVIALGNIKPKNLLDTSLGIDIIMEELGKMEHGVFA